MYTRRLQRPGDAPLKARYAHQGSPRPGKDRLFFAAHARLKADHGNMHPGQPAVIIKDIEIIVKHHAQFRNFDFTPFCKTLNSFLNEIAELLPENVHPGYDFLLGDEFYDQDEVRLALTGSVKNYDLSLSLDERKQRLEKNIEYLLNYITKQNLSPYQLSQLLKAAVGNIPIKYLNAIVDEDYFESAKYDASDFIQDHCPQFYDLQTALASKSISIESLIISRGNDIDDLKLELERARSVLDKLGFEFNTEIRKWFENIYWKDEIRVLSCLESHHESRKTEAIKLLFRNELYPQQDSSISVKNDHMEDKLKNIGFLLNHLIPDLNLAREWYKAKWEKYYAKLTTQQVYELVEARLNKLREIIAKIPNGNVSELQKPLADMFVELSLKDVNNTSKLHPKAQELIERRKQEFRYKYYLVGLIVAVEENPNYFIKNYGHEKSSFRAISGLQISIFIEAADQDSNVHAAFMKYWVHLIENTPRPRLDDLVSHVRYLTYFMNKKFPHDSTHRNIGRDLLSTVRKTAIRRILSIIKEDQAGDKFWNIKYTSIVNNQPFKQLLEIIEISMQLQEQIKKPYILKENEHPINCLRRRYSIFTKIMNIEN